MSSNTQFKVYLKYKGENTRHMMAQFALRTDAINYAWDASKGRYHHPDSSLMVLENGAKVMRFCQGQTV